MELGIATDYYSKVWQRAFLSIQEINKINKGKKNMEACLPVVFFLLNGQAAPGLSGSDYGEQRKPRSGGVLNFEHDNCTAQLLN